MTTREDIEKALDYAAQTREYLRAAMRDATTLEGLVILALITRAAELKNDIDSLLNCLIADERNGGAL